MAFLGWNIRHHIAWNGETEIVRLDGGEFKLSGLFVKPNGEGPHAAVVILHGSGRLDGIHDIPSYRVHANAFLRKGLAVLVYDKRGVGNSDGDFSVSTYDDFVQDAVAAVRYLRSRNDVDSLRIGLLGSSEGGWLTPEVATLAGDIAFVVNRCGPPLPWDETVLFEIENDLEAEGTDPEIIQEVLRLKRIIWKYYVDASTDSALATGTQRDEIDAALSALYARAVDSDSLGLPQALQDYDAESYARRASNVSYDPTPFLEGIEPPLLCVFGENDINVPTAKSVAALERLTREFERDITFKVYPDVGHSLFSVKGIFTAGFTGDYLDLIGNWARDHTAAK